LAPEELLSSLHAAGFWLRADGGRLLVSPADRLTGAWRAAIREHRGGLLALMGGSADLFAGLAPWGRGPWGGLPHPASPEYRAQLRLAAEYDAEWAALEAHNAAVRAGGDSHRHEPDASAAADEVVLDLGEIEHVDR